METLYLLSEAPETARTAADIIKSGGLVALPTETVYGLGANGLDPAAVKKIFEAKGRPQDNPLILHISGPEQIEDLCHSIPAAAYALAEAFWPGPLTMVLPAKDVVPLSTRAGLPSVAVRCPDCEITREIIRLSGVPIAAPSANISGKPSTTTAEHVRHDHDGRIDCIVDGGPCRVGVESTIVDLTEDEPRLLRPGGIGPEQLHTVLGDFLIDKAVTESVDKDTVVKAPGMKYRHYAPDCQVLIVDGDLPAAVSYVRKHWVPGNRVLCFDEEQETFAPFAPLAYGREHDHDTLMAHLFAALRELDDPAIGTVFARCPRGSGKALAVQNRLAKAAGFQHIHPREKSFVIGITGGTGCGKTTALNAIEALGGYIIDCDEVYHWLLKYDSCLSESILLGPIEARFPGTVENGQLNRKKLGSIVFNDPDALLDLNRITHSAVKREVLRQLPPYPSLVAIDAIGLFEGGLAELCDVTVAVTAPEKDRIARLMAREGIPEEYAASRIAAQKSSTYFAKVCDYTLENDTTMEQFRAKCLAFFMDLAIIKENL